MKEKIPFENFEIARDIFGQFDKNADIIRETLGVNISLEEKSIVILGETDKIKNGKELIAQLKAMWEAGQSLDSRTLNYAMEVVQRGEGGKLSSLSREVIVVSNSAKPVQPKTLGQLRYVSAIENNDIVFGIGPAGTGKTFLSIAVAVKKLKQKEISRIILTRPAVEAGESLGFLPGDLQEKVDPYLRPIYDALYELLGFETVGRFLEKGVIEVAPLAYMRGRTLDNSFVILDEAQNTTREQMKMFITRLGFNSKAVINGDITQIDLPNKKKSGLIVIEDILRGIEGIEFVKLGKLDVVRHSLVQKIIEAYERYEEGSGNAVDFSK